MTALQVHIDAVDAPQLLLRISNRVRAHPRILNRGSLPAGRIDCADAANAINPRMSMNAEESLVAGGSAE